MSDLNHCPALVLKSWLQAQNLVGDPEATAPQDWPAYHNNMPDGEGVPEDEDKGIVVVTDDNGKKAGRYMSGSPVFFYNVQLTLRAFDPDIGWLQLVTLLRPLYALTPKAPGTVTIGASPYRIHNASPIGVPGFAGYEPGTKRRCLFSANLQLTLATG